MYVSLHQPQYTETETNWDPKMEFQSGTLFQWTCGSKFFIPCYNHVVLRIMAASHLKVTLQKSCFELVFPIFCTWFSLALWVAKAMPKGEVLIGAHLCFHRNSNLFQSICLWYLKRKGERLFQFAWQNSFTWAICYINAWTPTSGTVNGCPSLVAFHLEHLPSFLWQRGKHIFWTLPNQSPNPFGSHLLFQFWESVKSKQKGIFWFWHKCLAVWWKMCWNFRSVELPPVAATLGSVQAGTWHTLRLWLPVRAKHTGINTA